MKVISPMLTRSPFSIPDSPEYVSVECINKMNSIYHLKKLEHSHVVILEAFVRLSNVKMAVIYNLLKISIC